MDAVDDYCASPDELMSSTNRTRFNRNSKINSFRSIIGVGGRRTGWTGPRCLKRDSSGLVDVHEFFSKDFSPISGSGHRRSNANTEDISVKNDGGFVFNKISPDNEINSRSNSGESCVTIPVSPPLHLEARKESVEVPVKREKVEEQKVAQGPSRDNSPIPAINGKDLMLSKSISFYEKLENSFLASKCPDNVDGVACTRSSRRHTDNAGVETPKSPSASGTDFSLDSLIDEVRAPLKIKGKRKNNNKQKKKSSSSASSEVSLYSNLEFIKILTPKTPLEKFSTNFSHDLSSDNLDDYSIKLSSISTPFYPSSGSVSISSNNNAGLSESLGSLSNDEAMTPSKTNFINSSKVISAAGENSTHLTSKFNNKTHTIQAFDMTLDISEADKQKMIIKPSPCNDEINPPQPDKSATANVYTDRSHSITQSRPMLNNQKETNISSKPHHSTQKDMSPPPPQNVPSINLQELPKNLSMSPVNVMQYGENQILENEVQHKISATESRVLQSPAHPLTSGCHQLPTFEREPSPFFAGNDIDIVPSPRADTLPNGHEDSQSLLAKLPSPAPNFDQYAADSHEDQMPARPNVYKSPHKSSSLKKSPVLPALSSYTNLTVTDSSASEKPKRKRGRPRKNPLPQDTQPLQRLISRESGSKLVSDANAPNSGQDLLEWNNTSIGDENPRNLQEPPEPPIDTDRNAITDTRKKKLPGRRRTSQLPQFAFEPDEPGELGARRSRRMRIRRLRFWEGERVVLGRNESGFYPVPVVKEVIRRDDAEQVDEKQQKVKERDKTHHNRPKRSMAIPKPVTVYNIVTGQEDKQHIVATPEMLNPRTVGAGDYKFQKIFSEGRFFASGMLVMPRGSEKPNKNSNGSAMTFFIVSGEVEVQIHKTKFVLRTGSQFFVPRGNQYRLVNVGARECKLFFCHGKEVLSQDLTM